MFPQLDDEATRKAYYKEFRKVGGLISSFFFVLFLNKELFFSLG